MYLTTIRVRRAKVQTLDGIVPRTVIDRLPKDGSRLAALQVCAGGKTIAVVTVERNAQMHRVAWQEKSVPLTGDDLLAFVKATIMLMDQSAAFLGQTIETAVAA